MRDQVSEVLADEPVGVGRVPLCGDLTCESYGCTQAALDAWNDQMQANARAAVRHAMGLPAEEA